MTARNTSLERLKYLLREATQGPWMIDTEDGVDMVVIVDDDNETSFTQIAGDLHQGNTDGVRDAELIVAAVNTLPWLIEVAERCFDRWVPFGSHVDVVVGELEFDGEDESGLPLWERPRLLVVRPFEELEFDGE